MTKTIATLLALAAFAAAAQTNHPLAVKGTMDIQYRSRQSPPGTKGVKDIYTVNVNFANSSLFHGTITDQPQIIDGWISKTVVQPRLLDYDIALDVVNPRNPAQTKNVGRMYGTVPVSSDGVYHYDTGSLLVDVLPIGAAAGFSSRFDGTAAGKPLARPANWLDAMQREAVNITRMSNGKASTVTLKKYDKMDFRGHVIAAGPVQAYQQVTVNGDMYYDYDKNCWLLNNFTAQYAENGLVKVDRISGTIRWVEAADRKTSGEGEYDFDVRVNEPQAAPTAAFDAAADESAFFTTDTSIPALTGTMKYKDTLKGDITMASAVTIDLVGNSLTKQQAMVLVKLVLFSCIVPFNSD